jgi:hypothetical protein
MDCLDAQAAISEALDGAAPDAAMLDAAKQHCRECADCASFVRALSAVKRAPLPEPPADLTDRVMAAVRGEAAAEQRRAEAAATAALAAGAGTQDAAGVGTSAGASTAPDDLPAGADESPTLLVPQRRSRARSTELAAWAAAAAVLVVGMGVVGVMGIRLISQGQPAASSNVVVGEASVPRDAGASDQSQLPVAESAVDSATKATSVSAGPAYIVYNGIAYRLVGPASVQKTQLKLLGTTRTSLDGGALRARDVLSAADSPGVYVENDRGELQEFQPLERTFEGRAYRLKSSDVSAFGAWPAMPTDIPQPSAADGSPAFSAAGADPSGVTIYRRTSSTTAEGIAIAPGTPADDPANGNPNWTWWTLAP